jgi:hypothetical protein
MSRPFWSGYLFKKLFTELFWIRQGILATTGIDTATIYHSYLAEGQNAKRVALIYEIAPVAVKAAVTYERSHAA